MEKLFNDVRYAIRSLISHRGFTLIAVITLALGIGANTAIFSVVNALLLRPLPFTEPDRLVQVWEMLSKLGRNSGQASYPNFADWREQNQVFEQLAAYTDRTFNLTGAGEPERIQGALVSPAFFPMLGIKPPLGRVLLPEEDHPHKVFSVVISERLWRRHFNSDPQIVGQTIRLDSESFTVVGVVPEIADVTGLPTDTEVWISMSHSSGFDNRRGHYLNVIARLKPGVTREQAQADMNRIAGRLAAQYPDSNTDHAVRLVPLQEQLVGDFKLALQVLLGAVLCVLLIASANVANMLLARGAGRQKEIAIRSALGAGRWRLVRQMLTESVLLSTVGGAVGLLLALWGVYLLVAFGPSELPRVKEIVVDSRVLGFTVSISMLTGIIFGIVPALQVSRPNLNEALKESVRGASSGGGDRRLRSLLVVSEIALSLVLLVGAGLLIRSFHKLQSVNPGFDPQNLLTMELSLRGPDYQENAPVINFYHQLLAKIKALPGVEAAGIRRYVPIAVDEDFAYLSFMVEGRVPDPANRPIAYYNVVSPDLFRTMDIPFTRGRPFDAHDVMKAQNVIIINETLARRYFPGQDPIGKRMTLNDETPNPKEEDWATIVGVVKDTKPRELNSEPVAEMYVPFAQDPHRSMAVMIRTTNKPAAMVAAVRREVRELDSNLPIYSIRTMHSVISESIAAPRFRTSLLAVFAIVALTLAMVGIYGVMSYSVTQRTREIGIRMAIGAQPRDVFRMVLGQGMLLTVAGLAIGLAGALALTRLMTTMLFGIKPTDPATFVGVAVVLAMVAVIACYIPGRRATKVDPVDSLRYE
jgi:putative ABC transport system permease protein